MNNINIPSYAFYRYNFFKLNFLFNLFVNIKTFKYVENGKIFVYNSVKFGGHSIGTWAYYM